MITRIDLDTHGFQGRDPEQRLGVRLAEYDRRSHDFSHEFDIPGRVARATGRAAGRGAPRVGKLRTRGPASTSVPARLYR